MMKANRSLSSVAVATIMILVALPMTADAYTSVVVPYARRRGVFTTQRRASLTTTRLRMAKSSSSATTACEGNDGRRAFLARSASLTLGSLVSASPAAASGKAANLPPTGAKAPSFDLPNSQGERTTLADLEASKKWTVLYFYPGAFTNGCTLEAKSFQRDIDAYRALNAQIVGVSVDSIEKNAQFCTSEGLDFYMLTDESGQVSKLYGSALSVPGFGTFSNRQTYLIDPNGNLRWVFTDVESHVARHSKEVLEKLEELATKA